MASAMFLHEIPAIAAGLDALTAAHPLFGNPDRSRFPWRRRDADFGGLTRMILGQQVSTHAAAAMEAKLELLMPEADPVFFLTLTDEQLRGAGFSRQKMRYGRALAETLVADPQFLARLPEMDDEKVIATLITLPGIGRWSAEVYLMFCLGRPDVWPAGDLGIVLGAQYLLGLPEARRGDCFGRTLAPTSQRRCAPGLGSLYAGCPGAAAGTEASDQGFEAVRP